MAQTLNATQLRSIAASLEIDGRIDLAAMSASEGHISEFVYTGEGQPVSYAARVRASVQELLAGMVADFGMVETIAGLRAAALNR